jgi:hypothetical protein
MKHPTIEPATIYFHQQACLSEAQTYLHAKLPGHSRTLYTSIGPDESNFISKIKGEKNPPPAE